MITYDERVHAAKVALGTVINQHGITILVDALRALAVENAAHWNRHEQTEEGCVWQDIVAVLRVLRNTTSRKLVGVEVPEEVK